MTMIDAQQEFSTELALLASVIRHEANALLTLATSLPLSACVLVHRLANLRGKVIFSGTGKSGLIARKIAATCSSLRIPACFMHTDDALHGDLGVIEPHDVIVGLSKSGVNQALAAIFMFHRQQQCLSSSTIATILITCARQATCQADLVVQLPSVNEACSITKAPTASTTLMLTFGDAVAIAASRMRNITANDFAHVHPSGTLGRTMLFTVASLMYTGNHLPLLKPTSSFADIIVTITEKKRGVGIVVDERKTLLGIITDGDLRRACQKGKSIFDQDAQSIMYHHPKTTTPETLAIEALRLMEQHKITTLVVVKNNYVVGLIHVHDILKAGIEEL